MVVVDPAIVGAVVLLIIIGVVVFLLTKDDASKPAAPVLVSPSESMVFVSIPAPIQVKWDPVSDERELHRRGPKVSRGCRELRCDQCAVPYVGAAAAARSSMSSTQTESPGECA